MGSSSSKQQTLSVNQINAKSLSDATAQWNSTWYPQAQEYTRDYTDGQLTDKLANYSTTSDIKGTYATQSALTQAQTALQQSLSGLESTVGGNLDAAKSYADGQWTNVWKGEAQTYTDGQLASYSKTADIASTYATKSSLTESQSGLNTAISDLKTALTTDLGTNLTAAKTYADDQWKNDWSKQVSGTYATRQALSDAQSGLDSSISGLQTSLTSGLATNLTAAKTYADTALTNKFASDATFGRNLTVSGELSTPNWAFFQEGNKGCLGYYKDGVKNKLLCLDTNGNLQDADNQYLFLLRSDSATPLSGLEHFRYSRRQ